MALLLASTPTAAQVQWQDTPALSQHLISRLVQDDTGFLWLATDDGVYRYDGYQTVPLSRLAHGGPRLPATRYALARSGPDDLWLLSPAGLSRYSLASHQLVAVPLPPLAAGWQEAQLDLVADTALNRLWVFTNEHDVLGLALDTGQLVPGARWHFTDAITGLSGEPGGGFWVHSESLDKAYVYPGRHPQWYCTGGKYLFPLAGTQPRLFASFGALYAARPDGTLREVRRWLPSQSGNFSEASTMFDPRWQVGHEQWVAGNQLVRLHRTSGGQTIGEVTVEPTQFANSQDYGLPLYYRSFTDAQGTEWCFSPILRGCYRQHHSAAVQPLPRANGKWYSSRAICRLPDQRLLISSYEGLLVQPPGAVTQPLWPALNETADNLINHKIFNNLLPMGPGQVLASDHFGLSILSVADWHLRLLPGPPGIPFLQVNALLAGRGGRIWVGAQQGLYWLDAAHPWPHPAQLAVRNITALAADSTGHLWAATTDGLYRLTLASGQLESFSYPQREARHLPTNELLSLWPVGQRIWVGTRNQGLLLVDPAQGVMRRLDQAGGLPSNIVCSLLGDRLGQLWLGTYGGVVRYQPANGQLSVLTTASGLADSECNYLSAFRDETGDLYFGSVKGVTCIVPQGRNAAASHARLVVSSLDQQADGDTLARRSYPLPGAALALHLRDEATATLQVALTDYASPENAHYLYQLRGSPDSTWHSLEPLRTLRLHHLPVGHFQLRIRGESASGQRAANMLTIPVDVQHTWWKNPWVWTLSGLLLLGGLGTYLWRARRHDQRQRLEIRRRLAYDLHDELGALLIRASLQAAHIQDEYPVTTATTTPLLSDLQAASQAMRDVVWGIDPHINTLGDLLDRMRDLLTQLTPLTTCQLEFREAGLQEAKTMSPAYRQHIYAIFKEAVTNSLRHARCSKQLIIIMEQQANNLLLEVRDDGQPQPISSRRGVGLRSMQQRALLLRGQLETGPQPEGGFLVRLRLSL